MMPFHNLNIAILHIPEYIMAQNIDNNDFLQYEDPSLGIKIEYPFNWTKIDNPATASNPIVSFSPPQEGFSKLFIEVNKLNLGNITLSEYATNQINILGGMLFNFKLDQLSPTTIAGTEHAQMVVYTFMLQNIEFKKMEIWLIKDSRLYTINYLAEEKKYLTYLPIAERMINTFRVT
jgi:eukaryotic-like serine/threonine-protein kinase